MKRARLIYALPLACVMATALVRPALAEYNAPDNNATNHNELWRNYLGSSQLNTVAMSDAAITARVKNALIEDNLPSQQIGVATNNGVVQLSGFLGSQADVDRAVAAARSVQNVRGVENNIQTR